MEPTGASGSGQFKGVAWWALAPAAHAWSLMAHRPMKMERYLNRTRQSRVATELSYKVPRLKPAGGQLKLLLNILRFFLSTSRSAR